jgi:hypothetical protein
MMLTDRAMAAQRAALLAALSIVAACGREKAASPGPVRLDAAPAPAIADLAPPPDAASSRPPTAPVSDEPPPRLACIVRHYVGRAERRGDDWFLVLPDGAALPFDDHLAKDAAQAFDAPDLEDMFSPHYTIGPIAPITDPNQDPGRNRVDALFAATYGQGPREIQSSLAPWTILGAKYPVHRRVLPSLDRVASSIAALVRHDPTIAAYFQHMGGTVAWRTIAGSKKLSTHAYGIAVDIGTAAAHYWRNARAPAWQNAIPESIVHAFESEGFIWGGRWFHYDTMHFEYRPELLDPACQ